MRTYYHFFLIMWQDEVEILPELPRSKLTKSGVLIYDNVLRTQQLSLRARGVIFRLRSCVYVCFRRKESLTNYFKTKANNEVWLL